MKEASSLPASGELVRGAFAALRETNPAYYEKMFRQRSDVVGAGSTYSLQNLVESGALPVAKLAELEKLVSPDELCRVAIEEVLLEESRIWYPVQHPNLGREVLGFRTRLRGTLGLVSLQDIPQDTLLYVADVKDTGFVNVLVSKEVLPRENVLAEDTYAILGQEEVGGPWVVFTFHPGEPVVPEKITTDDLPPGTVLTAALARQKGFCRAKVGSAMEIQKAQLQSVSLEAPDLL